MNEPPDWEEVPPVPEGAKPAHYTFIIDEHSDPETVARIVAMNLVDVYEAYVLVDDGFGNLSRPEKPVYPKTFTWEDKK